MENRMNNDKNKYTLPGNPEEMKKKIREKAKKDLREIAEVLKKRKK